MTVVVAQLTDLHLRPPGELAVGVDAAACLHAAVGTIRAENLPVDAIVVTGDIAENGRREEYERFPPAFTEIGVPVYAVPGNHDRPEELWRSLRDFAERTPDGDIAFVRDVGELRMVLLDTTVPEMDHGLLSPERLRWLDAALAARPRQPTLIAMHHPPFRIGIPGMDAINCRDGLQLAALLDRHPQVLAVTCGHAHRSIFTSFAGRPASVAPSPAFAVRLSLDGAEVRLQYEPPGMHLHVWSEEGGPFGALTTHRVPIVQA